MGSGRRPRTNEREQKQIKGSGVFLVGMKKVRRMAVQRCSSTNQIVIPNEAWQAMGVKGGDKLLVIVRNGRDSQANRPTAVLFDHFGEALRILIHVDHITKTAELARV